jgi:hypothetical protein
MATEKQIAANRRNAKKSTGPRTKQGKAISSQNGLKHGLLAKNVIIPTESKAEFDFHRDEVLTDLKPVGPMESILANRIVELSWRLSRSSRFLAATITTMDKEAASKPLTNLRQSMIRRALGQSSPPDGPHVPKPVLKIGRLIIKDFSNARVLDRLSMYERRTVYCLRSTIDQFFQLRLIRQMNPPDNV